MLIYCFEIIAAQQTLGLCAIPATHPRSNVPPAPQYSAHRAPDGTLVTTHPLSMLSAVGKRHEGSFSLQTYPQRLLDSPLSDPDQTGIAHSIVYSVEKSATLGPNRPVMHTTNIIIWSAQTKFYPMPSYAELPRILQCICCTDSCIACTDRQTRDAAESMTN